MQRKLHGVVLALLAVIGMAACGGGDDDDDGSGEQRTVQYEQLVVFGDSLSDVGTYATPGLLAAFGTNNAGKYTINGPGPRIWVERLAERAAVAAPCAAVTGLESSGVPPVSTYAGALTDHPDCYGYAQGGARVSDPIGPYNKALLNFGNSDGYLGQLTHPVQAQINRHLSRVGNFSGKELVTVLAGGNDVSMNLAAISAAGGTPASVGAAFAAMTAAGDQLAGYVDNLIVGRGAKRVVVLNLPDMSRTPQAVAAGAQTQGLILEMVQRFNAALAAGLDNQPSVLLIDAFEEHTDWMNGNGGFSNVNGFTCAVYSLLCSAGTLQPGTDQNYLYADTVHLTPFANGKLADFVIANLRARPGWW
jgi:outer membrane lipase/esterase